LKTDFSNTVQDIIQYDEVGGASIKPIIRTKFFNDSTNTFEDFEDMERRTITLTNVNKRYQSYSFMPPTQEIRFTLNNFNQVYSTGSGNPKASILKKNLKIKAFSGFELTVAEIQTSQSDDFLTTTKKVHIQEISGKLFADITSFSGTLAAAAEMGITYDDGTYDDDNYAYAGYYQKTATLSDIEKMNNSEYYLNKIKEIK